MTDYTFIYSSPCKEALEELVTTFANTFGLPATKASDLFRMGVFCKEETYANYDWENDSFNLPADTEVPDALTSVCSSNQDRLDYVRRTIEQILDGEIEKPDWMLYVEENLICDNFSSAPSTYLVLKAKSNEYEQLAKSLLNFLYSPNYIIKMID